jgi:hypothetical protein
MSIKPSQKFGIAWAKTALMVPSLSRRLSLLKAEKMPMGMAMPGKQYGWLSTTGLWNFLKTRSAHSCRRKTSKSSGCVLTEQPVLKIKDR